MEREVDDLRTRAASQLAYVEIVRGRLAEAMLERETLERLKAQRGDAHALEHGRARRTEGDEISLQAHLNAHLNARSAA